MDFTENWGFGASPVRTSVASIPAGGFFCFVLNVTFVKKHDFSDSLMIFHQNDPNLSSTQGTTYKTGILDPKEFWWVPQIPEMVVPTSSHDRSCSKESSQNALTGSTIS